MKYKVLLKYQTNILKSVICNSYQEMVNVSNELNSLECVAGGYYVVKIIKNNIK